MNVGRPCSRAAQHPLVCKVLCMVA